MVSSIIHQLGLKYGLPDEVVQLICTSTFEFIADRIRNSDSKDMRLYYLGKFKMKNKYKDEGNTNTVISKKTVVD